MELIQASVFWHCRFDTLESTFSKNKMLGKMYFLKKIIINIAEYAQK